jgi:hypothetical protein
MRLGPIWCTAHENARIRALATAATLARTHRELQGSGADRAGAPDSGRRLTLYDGIALSRSPSSDPAAATTTIGRYRGCLRAAHDHEP